MLSRSKKLLIVGQPGGGKTTFLKLIACVLAKDNMGKTVDGRAKHLGLSLNKPAPIPIFIRLAAMANAMKDDCADGGIGTAWRCMKKTMENIFGKNISDIFQELLSKGKCAFLLDGLDEVADEKLRNRITDVVNSALNHWKENLFILSSRPFGFSDIASLKEVATVHIDPFGEKEIIEFIDRWVKTMYPDREERKLTKYLPELESAIVDSPSIRKLARNPVMLTCLCVVHWNERKLPEGKSDLLSAVLRWLINAREDNRKKRGYEKLFATECFRALSFAMTSHPNGKQVIVDIVWAAEQLVVPYSERLGIDDEKTVRREGIRFLEEEMIDSGIVERYRTGQIKFWHLSFQEHYTARALLDLSREEWWNEIKPVLYDKQWSEVLDHFAGCLVGMGTKRVNFLVENILKTANDKDLASIARTVGLLARILSILKVYGYKPPKRLGWEDVRNKVMNIFNPGGANLLSVKERIEAAEALGQAGDPRFDSIEPEMLPIKKMDNVLLGKYSVTVREYLRFVENKGYENQQFWIEGWEIKEKKGWNNPDDWDEQIEHLNRPVVYVSWFEALAYCKWLTIQTRQNYRLPISKEWKSAAINPKGEYPWGGNPPDKERLNCGSIVGHPTPVGIYPDGVAPGGHFDMSGNVWEWNEDTDGSDRVFRGGGWCNTAGDCRSAFRGRVGPSGRDYDLGFRLTRSLP